LITRLPVVAAEVDWRLYTGHRAEVSLPGNAKWVDVAGDGLRWHHRTARLANAECAAYVAPTSFLVPQLLHIPYAVTVHDLVAFRPEARAQRRSGLIERLTLKRTLRRAGGILTVSEATKRDISERFGSSLPPITVTPEAADGRFFRSFTADELTAVRRKFGLPDEFILITGTIEPRKNHRTLFAAHAALPEELRRAHPLVVAGKRGWESAEIWSELSDLVARGEAFYLDYVDEADLPGLYAVATVFAYPSLYEGFGLPILEAMAAGTAVITSKISSLPEVGGTAVRYVNPMDTSDLTETLIDLLTDEAARRRLVTDGIVRAKTFSWDRTARQTVDALRQIVA
jgi:glycosyltransferase involved in cell wall biosynthesis